MTVPRWLLLSFFFVADAQDIFIFDDEVPANVVSLYSEFCIDQDDQPANPCKCNFLKSYLPPELNIPSVRGIEVECANGVAIASDGVSYPCHNTKLMSFVNINELNPLNTNGVNGVGEETNDIWGWTSAEGNEIVMIGLMTSTSFVDITDSANPVVLGQLPTAASFSITFWRDIKTYGNYAYIVSENAGHGLQVIELTQMVGLDVSGGPEQFEATHLHTGFGNAHNIAINEESGFAYIVGSNQCSGGLYMMDIGTNPAAPSFVGCFSEDNYVHDVQCVNYAGPDTRFSGREICFACNEDTVTIVDVEDKSNPIQLSRTSYTGVAYTHQGWLTEDQTTFLFGDELDENGGSAVTTTFVLNVENLQSPVIVGRHLAEERSIDHNLYTLNDHIYETNYRSGLQVLRIGANIAETSDLILVASFDVFPQDDLPLFNGAWSNYPYFPSGNVVISSIERGLFVVSVDTEGPLPSNGGTNVGPDNPIDTGDGDGDSECEIESNSCSGFFGWKDGYRMYKPVFFNLFCFPKCVDESDIGDRLEDGWRCGQCGLL